MFGLLHVGLNTDFKESFVLTKTCSATAYCDMLYCEQNCHYNCLLEIFYRLRIAAVSLTFSCRQDECICADDDLMKLFDSL